MYYSKEFPKGRLAYKFKKKLPSGDDIVYWSYDQAGKSRVGAGHHTDAKRVPGTIEYRKRVQDNAKIVEGILEGQIKQSGDRHKEQRVNGVLQWERYTNLDPATAAQDIAAWAEENNYDMTRMGSGIQTAYAMMVADAQKTGKKPTNLIPYLEEATIKERLLGQAAELTQAKVGDKIVSMEPKVLTDLNKQVMAVSESLGMHQDTFWNNAVKLSNSKSHEGNFISNKSKREGSIPANIQVNDSLKISWKIFIDRPSKFNIDTSYNFQKKITEGYMTVNMNEKSYKHRFNYTGKTVGEPIEEYIIDKFKSSTIGTINFDNVGFYDVELKIKTSSQNPLQWQWLWLEEVTD